MYFEKLNKNSQKSMLYASLIPIRECFYSRLPASIIQRFFFNIFQFKVCFNHFALGMEKSV